MRMEMESGATRVVSRLLDAGYAAYAVGGCVRDALLGKAPSDWDVCTSALPEQTLALFGEGSCIPTGLKHGTITVKMDEGLYEVTTFRTDGAYTDGRHPDSVDFVADVREDLARRDFTINAMAYNDAEGLVDPFGGREDLLERRIVRAVGDPMQRFSEDALRVMRLFRFAARYGLSIDAATLQAALALCGNLSRVSGERIREELLKLLAAPKPSGYLPHAVVSVAASGMGNVDERTYARVLSALDALAPDALLRLAALLSPLCAAYGGGAAQDVLLRLRCSSREQTRVMTALEGALDAYEEEGIALRTRARAALGRLGIGAIEDICALSAVIREEEDAQKIAAFAAYARDAHRRGLCCRTKELAVNGGDVMRAANAKAGPMLGEMLARLLDAVIKEELPNERDTLLAAAKRMQKEEGNRP